MRSLFNCIGGIVAMALIGLSVQWNQAAIGVAVPDNVASELRGGCVGIKSVRGCTFCSAGAYTNGSETSHADPGAVTSYYCKVTVNGEDACNTCSQVFVSCSGS